MLSGAWTPLQGKAVGATSIPAVPFLPVDFIGKKKFKERFSLL